VGGFVCIVYRLCAKRRLSPPDGKDVDETLDDMALEEEDLCEETLKGEMA